jgi:hypothetical protein
MADLYLHDSDFDAGQEKIIAKGMFSIAEKPVPIDDWPGLATAIQKHTKIGHLAFSFHSFSGGMIVGSDGRELGEASVDKLFTKPPQVDRISFFGCNVGNRPVQMAAFGKLFGAKSVTASPGGRSSNPSTSSCRRASPKRRSRGRWTRSRPIRSS